MSHPHHNYPIDTAARELIDVGAAALSAAAVWWLGNPYTTLLKYNTSGVICRDRFQE